MSLKSPRLPTRVPQVSYATLRDLHHFAIAFAAFISDFIGVSEHVAVPLSLTGGLA